MGGKPWQDHLLPSMISAYVLNYLIKPVDFYGGAQTGRILIAWCTLRGNDFIVLETNTCPRQIDRRPSFIYLKPNIALLSGISLDHI